MAKLPTPDPFQTLLDSIAPLIPQPVKDRYAKLTPSQKQHVFFGGAGLFVFLILWAILGGLMDPAPALAPANRKIVASGPTTAIVEPVQHFPDTKPVENKPVKKDLIDSLTLTEAQKAQLLKLRQSVNNEYKNTLSFPLDESKMIGFAQAATKIDMINFKWDTLIAGAPTDMLAADYLTSATLEIRQQLTQSIDITESEYNEIFSLATRDKRFNEVANAYKKLVTEGIWGPVTPTVLKINAAPVDPSTLFPVARPLSPAPSSAAPAANGTHPN